MLYRTTVVIGCGGLCFHGMGRYVSWMRDNRNQSITMWIDGDMVEVGNRMRQWQLRVGGQSKVWSVKEVVGAYGMERLAGSGAVSIFPLNVYVKGYLEKGEEGRIMVPTTDVVYGECSAGPGEVKIGMLTEDMRRPGKIGVAEWVSWRMLAAQTVVVAMPDNHKARMMAYELGRQIVGMGRNNVVVAAAGNWTKGGWASVCKMGMDVDGKVAVEGDWTKYRPDIAEEAKAEEEGRASGLACASMGEQSAGSNGWTAQCLWSALAAVEKGWTGEYVWDYQKDQKGRDVVVTQMFTRE